MFARLKCAQSVLSSNERHSFPMYFTLTANNVVLSDGYLNISSLSFCIYRLMQLRLFLLSYVVSRVLYSPAVRCQGAYRV